MKPDMLNLSLIPVPEIETKRLLLRPLIRPDAHDLFDLRTDPLVLQSLDREPPRSLEDIYGLMDSIDDSLAENTGINWVVSLKEDRKLIGTIGYWRIDRQNHRAEIGYMLRSDFWRKGITNESMAAVLEYGFNSLNFHSVEANINPSNTASRHLLEKFGFVQEAYFRENYYAKGRFLDSAILSLLAADFKTI
ncbi:MAG TPA: GNAT family N-acetyltransferase [Sphingobacteriaceae bacterium]